LKRITQALLIGCLIANFILFAWIGISVLMYPYGVNFGEAIMLDLAQRLIDGQAIYSTNLQNPPFFFSNYPPFYPALMAATQVVTSLPLLFLGRAISLLSALASLVLLWKIAFKATGNLMAGLLAAGLFIGHPYVITWSILARMDLLALVFSLLSFWLIIQHSNSITGIVMAVFCLLVAIFTRQTYLFAVPLASMVWLWRKDLHGFFLYIITLIAGSIILFVLFNSISHGGFFFDVVLANVGIYHLSRTLIMLRQFAFTWPIVILLSAISIIQVLRIKRPSPIESKIDGLDQPLPAFGFVPYTIGAVLASLMIGKEGSDTNYLLELIVALSLWGACGVVWLSSRFNVRQSLVSTLLIVQLFWIFIGVGMQQLNKVETILSDRPWKDALFQEVKSAAKQGQVLADDDLDLVVLAGQHIYYEPFLFGQLYATNQWNPTTFIDEIRNQQFPLILIGGEDVYKECCWPAPLADAVKSSYLIESLPGLQVGKPKEK
jgi:hypothetical protein